MELEGEEVVAKFANTTQHGAMEGKTQTHEVEYFNLEMVSSVGCRVKSNRGVQFRKWANIVHLDKTETKNYRIFDKTEMNIKLIFDKTETNGIEITLS